MITSTDTENDSAPDTAPEHPDPEHGDHEPAGGGRGDAGSHAHEPSGDLTVEVERLEGSQVRLTVVAAAGDVDDAVRHALGHLSKRYRFPGFRPGKAPAPIVERTIGWPVIAQEAVEALVPSVYSRALREARIAALTDPQLDLGDAPLERGAPFTFRATVTVQPEVDLGDYASLRVERETTEIDDSRVDEAIESVRVRHGELVEVDRPAQSGDVLLATMTMRRGDEVLGGAGEPRDVELDRETLLPGLADALIGLAAGESSTVDITLPDTYPNEELRGQVVSVESVVTTVRERNLPELDDALAALDGHGETLLELREWYRARLVESAERHDDEAYEGKLLERLVEGASVDVPTIMVEREIDRQLRDMELRLAGSGLRLDRYLEYTGESLEKVREQRRDTALRRVTLELVLEALAEAEGIEIDEADVAREEATVIGDRRVTQEQRRRIHMAAHRDLLLRAAGQRALEIARGDG